MAAYEYIYIYVDNLPIFSFRIAMGSSNIRDLLTSFSPSLDFFAIISGDGQIKVPKSFCLEAVKSEYK